MTIFYTWSELLKNALLRQLRRLCEKTVVLKFRREYGVRKGVALCRIAMSCRCYVFVFNVGGCAWCSVGAPVTAHGKLSKCCTKTIWLFQLR